jgi:MFS family permease
MSENSEIRNENFVEETLEEIGAFGKYQKLNLFMMFFLATLPAITIYVTVFNLAEPKLKCMNTVLNQTIENDRICEVWSNFTKSKQENSLETVYSCEFDKTYYGKTLKTDWNLYCSRAYLSSLTQTFNLVGSVFAIFNGYFGDHFGRKKSIIAFLLIIGTSLLVSQLLISNLIQISISTKYIIYAINQFIIGTFSYCLYVTSYLLMLESTTRSYHTIFSNIHLSIYVVGEIFVLIPSYFIRDWEINNWIIIGFTAIAILISLKFLTESPKWLVSLNRLTDAGNLLKKIAVMNGKQMSESFDKKLIETEKCIPQSSSKVEQKQNLKAMLKQICLPVKFNLIKLILLACVWLSLNLLYYGVSLGVTSIDSINPYLMYLFSSIAEFCGYMLCLINDRIGRRKALMIYFLLSGIICITISFIPRNQDLNNNTKVIIDAAIIITLASIGKCMASAAFNTCYVFTANFYPTNVRNFAFSLISCIGNIGNL